jgi:phasin family protein
MKLLHRTILVYTADSHKEDDMTMTIEPLLASAKDQAKAMQTLATFGYAGIDRFAQFNFYAGLAALDNSNYFFTSLIKSKDIQEMVALQMRAMLPAAESAKVYARQTLALAAETSIEFDQVIESQLSSLEDKIIVALDKELGDTEASDLPVVGMLKDTLKVTKENALSARATIKRTMYDALNLRPVQGEDQVTDVVAKTPKSKKSTKSSAKAG